jgi:hypothetical protein
MGDIRNSIGHSISLLSGLVLGAAAMYILDPDRGERRRALARDKAVHGARVLGMHADKRLRDLRNHAYGSVAEWRSTLRDRVRELPDDVLAERVRAQIGHVVSHPGALDVRVEDGCVVIRGPVLAEEVDRIEQRLHATRGVWNWRLEVEPHAGDDNVPGLQGKSRAQRKRERGEHVDEGAA